MNTIENFVDSIKKSLENENYYAALGIALALPDICGNLEFPTQSSNARYKDFFTKYLDPNYNQRSILFTASDCYALRCSFLHEASADISEQRAREILSKFKFSINLGHLIKVEDILILDVSAFCSEIIDAVNKWLEDMKDNIDVQNRINLLVTIETKPFHTINLWLGDPDL